MKQDIKENIQSVAEAAGSLSAGIASLLSKIEDIEPESVAVNSQDIHNLVEAMRNMEATVSVKITQLISAVNEYTDYVEEIDIKVDEILDKVNQYPTTVNFPIRLNKPAPSVYPWQSPIWAKATYTNNAGNSGCESLTEDFSEE